MSEKGEEMMMEEKTTSLGIGRATMESISERLSEVEDLYFPNKALNSSTLLLPSQRKALLFDLLSRDVPVFLGILLFHYYLFTSRLVSIN